MSKSYEELCNILKTSCVSTDQFTFALVLLSTLLGSAVGADNPCKGLWFGEVVADPDRFVKRQTYGGSYFTVKLNPTH